MCIGKDGLRSEYYYIISLYIYIIWLMFISLCVCEGKNCSACISKNLNIFCSFLFVYTYIFD